MSLNSKSASGFMLFSPPTIFGAMKVINSCMHPALIAAVAKLGPHSQKTLLQPFLASKFESNIGLSEESASISTPSGILLRYFLFAVEES